MIKNDLHRCIEFALERGYQMDEGAFKFLTEVSKSRSPLEVIQKVIAKMEALKEETFIIDKETIEKFSEDLMIIKVEKYSVDAEAKPAQPYAKSIEPKIEVLEDPTGKIGRSGTINDFIRYFTDRFRKIERMLKSRSDFKDAIPI
ncbi:MAG: hypothetical protein QXL67_01550, partial [Candidatus Bathyarchaeia archaeon]